MALLSYLLSTDIYTPSMPEIERYFNATSDEVQRTMSYFLLGAVLTCAAAGLFADRIGKKKFLMCGLALAACGSIITIFCPTLEWLVFGRLIQGLGGGVAPVICFASIQELYREDQVTKIYGLMGVSAAGIPAVAPLLGGVISTHFGWHLIFVLILFLFVMSFICVWLYLPSSLNKRAPSSGISILGSYKKILSSRTFLAIALLSPLYNSIEWFHLTFLPFYMQDHIGISAEMYGVVIGFLFAWFAVGSYFGSKLVLGIGNHKSILIGLYLGIISGLMMWCTTVFFPTSVIAICIPLSIFYVGFGILFPSSVSGSLNVFKESKTRASSIRSLFITSFAYFGSFSAEWAPETSLSGMSIYISACVILALAIYHMRAKTIS